MLPGVGLPDILEVVDDFGCASLDLVAWEFSLTPAGLREVWEDAIESGFIELVAAQPGSEPADEAVYVLSGEGAGHLRSVARASPGNLVSCLTCGTRRAGREPRCSGCGHEEVRAVADGNHVAGDTELIDRVRQALVARAGLTAIRADVDRSAAARERAQAIEERLRAQCSLLRARIARLRPGAPDAPDLPPLERALREAEAALQGEDQPA